MKVDGEGCRHNNNLEELTFEEVQKRFVRRVLETDGERQQTRYLVGYWALYNVETS